MNAIILQSAIEIFLSFTLTHAHTPTYSIVCFSQFSHLEMELSYTHMNTHKNNDSEVMLLKRDY